MTKKRKRCRANDNGLGPAEQLTPRQACAYAAQRGVYLNTNILMLLRRDGKGPKYLIINDRWVRYMPRFLDPLIEARKPRLIDPGEQVKGRR